MADIRAAIEARRYRLAKALVDSRLEQRPEDVEGLCLGALVYWHGAFDPDDAAAMLARARLLAPDRAPVFTLSAELELHFGRLETAGDYAKRALAIDDGNSTAYVVLARSAASDVPPETLERMIELADDSELSQKRRRHLLNAIGRVYDALGEFDAAFGYFSESNALAKGAYRREQAEAYLAQARSVFNMAFIAKRKSFGLSNPGMIFIIGMPRSGSTLLEQAFAAHPGVDSCGESDAVSLINRALHKKALSKTDLAGAFDHVPLLTRPASMNAAQTYLRLIEPTLKKPDRTHHLDKKLSNFFHVPLIKLMFPEAHFLHAHRHPLDLCLSCFTQDFDRHEYANDLTHLAHFYQIYTRYMQLWSRLYGAAIRHCSYERAIASFTEETQAGLSFAGLDWSEACAEPHRVERFVGTSSAAQVRAPIYGTSVGRWRNYEKHLKPLIDGLGGYKAIMTMHPTWD